MKKLFKKTWFQILVFGVLVGLILIIIDEKFGLFSSQKNEGGTYNGPVSVEKDKTYFTQAIINESSFDFGKVKEGDTLTHVFTMTNKGNEPLIFYKSVGSCDCVGAEYSKDMVLPGKDATIKVYFNTKGRKGSQNKTIVLTCNTDPADMVLALKADVE